MIRIAILVVAGGFLADHATAECAAIGLACLFLAGILK